MTTPADAVLAAQSPLTLEASQAQVRARFPNRSDRAGTVSIYARFYARHGRGARSGSESALPPLTQALTGSRAAGTPRMRLALWLQLLTERGGGPVHLPTADAIRVLGLIPPNVALESELTGDDKRNATRRLLRAVDYLDRAGSLMRSGRGVLELRDPWTGQPWRPPSPGEHSAYMAEREERLKEWGGNLVRTPSYFEGDPIGIPIDCFASGAMSLLTGAALMSVLVLIDNGAHLDWSPIQWKRQVRYGISRTPWIAGVQELMRYGWLDRRSEARPGLLVVHQYRLHLSRMGSTHYRTTGWSPVWERYDAASR